MGSVSRPSAKGASAGPIELVDRVAYLLELCRGQRVLHLGCTNSPYTAQSLADGSLLHLRLQEVAAELWGVDNDDEALETLAVGGVANLIKADLEQLDKADLEQLDEGGLEQLDKGETSSRFDVILAGEVIEHLSNPGLFLASARRLMDARTRLVLTTVNAYCAMRFVRYAMRGRGGRAEPVHPDHVAYYSYATIRVLLDRHGLAVDRFSFYDLGAEHRPHNRLCLNWINDACVRMSRQLADGIVVECTLD